MNQQNLSSFIWSVADLLRGDYKHGSSGGKVRGSGGVAAPVLSTSPFVFLGLLPENRAICQCPSVSPSPSFALAFGSC